MLFVVNEYMYVGLYNRSLPVVNRQIDSKYVASDPYALLCSFAHIRIVSLYPARHGQPPHGLIMIILLSHIVTLGAYDRMQSLP